MYQLFGKMAKSIADSSLVVGRTTLQKFSEPYMIRDIVDKLELTAQDQVLEIGCGTGILLFPLSVIAIIKRFRPRAMGRASNIHKRTSHITLVVTEK